MWEFMSHTCDAIIGLYAADAHVGLNHPMNGSLLLSYPQTSTAWWVSCALTCCQHTHTHARTHTHTHTHTHTQTHTHTHSKVLLFQTVLVARISSQSVFLIPPTHLNTISILIYHVCVCVCVCVREKERDN